MKRELAVEMKLLGSLVNAQTGDIKRIFNCYNSKWVDRIQPINFY
jgi:hypothetical protein